MHPFSSKYPRSLHLPWSPGGTQDDKRMLDVSGLLNVEVVITEKCDGSNLTYTRDHVFARSHVGPPTHRSFDFAKATHAQIREKLPPNVSLFVEYCYAVHSIEYGALPGYSLVFGARDDVTGVCWSWGEVCTLAAALELPTVPLLFSGVCTSERALQQTTQSLAAHASAFGGTREGVVVRYDKAFESESFSKNLAKWVRKDHVTTDEHWQNLPIRVQPMVHAPQ